MLLKVKTKLIFYNEWLNKIKFQDHTDYDLKDKLLKPDVENDTMVEFNPKLLNSQNFKILVQLPKILQDSGKLGEFQLEIFNIFISSLKTYEKELIIAV